MSSWRANYGSQKESYTKSMKFNLLLRFAVFAPIFWAAAANAQTVDAEDPLEADDEAITVLDQVVPVADEGPPEEGPIIESLDERALLLAEFERFEQLRAAGSLDEAENIAKRMVELSIRATGPTSNDTARALTNLAIVQHDREDFEAAKQNFTAAIENIEENEDQLNENLINPLRGLGAAQLESGRPDLAARTFRRAVHISHVNEGPHNLDQIGILESLAETNLRLGNTEKAKNNHDMIYALNVRHYSNNSMEIVPSLLRRASWQRRTGYILDERATYRRVIRIIESTNGKGHISLIRPLLRLGESYFFVDTSDTLAFQSSSSASGEMYFKRAARIAEENPESDWMTLALAKLALGDYYNFRTDLGRSRKTYREAWELMSAEEDRLESRKKTLEVLTVLNEDSMPRYAGNASGDARQAGDADLREGRIMVSFDVNARGRVTGMKVVEASPIEFESMRRSVQREVRSRVYRPRFEDAEPVETPNQALTHTFFYRQQELEKLREENGTAPESGKELAPQADSG